MVNGKERVRMQGRPVNPVSVVREGCGPGHRRSDLGICSVQVQSWGKRSYESVEVRSVLGSGEAGREAQGPRKVCNSKESLA